MEILRPLYFLKLSKLHSIGFSNDSKCRCLRELWKLIFFWNITYFSKKFKIALKPTFLVKNLNSMATLFSPTVQTTYIQPFKHIKMFIFMEIMPI